MRVSWSCEYSVFRAPRSLLRSTFRSKRAVAGVVARDRSRHSIGTSFRRRARVSAVRHSQAVKLRAHAAGSLLSSYSARFREQLHEGLLRWRPQRRAGSNPWTAPTRADHYGVRSGPPAAAAHRRPRVKADRSPSRSRIISVAQPLAVDVGFKGSIKTHVGSRRPPSTDGTIAVRSRSVGEG